MHRCLQVPEIVILLSKALDQTNLFSEEYPDDRDLLSMALTCRAFLDPALDALWGHISSLDPIISCLPQNLWRKKTKVHDVDGDRYPVTTLYLRRAMTARDLERYLRFYAPRIRSFYFTADSEDTRGYRIFSSEAFLALQMATGLVPGALSPNLRSFHEYIPGFLYDILKGVYPFMSLFLGRRVTSLDFDSTYDPEELLVASSIQNAIESLPDLEDITFFTGLANDLRCRIPLLEDVILNSTWTRLKSAFLTTIESPAALACLAALPNLETLGLNNLALSPASWRSLDASRDLTADTLWFPSLRSLSFNFPDGGVVSATCVLRRLQTRNNLRYLRVSCSSECDPSEEVQSFFDAVSRRSNPAVFQELRYNSHLSLRARSGQPDLSSENTGIDVSSLLVLRRLRVLCLEFDTLSIALPPDAAQQIPSAWPNLEHLYLRSITPTGTSIDRAGLKTILRACNPMPVFIMKYVGEVTSGNDTSDVDEVLAMDSSNEDSEAGSDEDSESSSSGEDSKSGSHEDSDIGSDEGSNIAPDDELDGASDDEADGDSDQAMGQALQEEDDEAEDATVEHYQLGEGAGVDGATDDI